jgi:hypothetical protein
MLPVIHVNKLTKVYRTSLLPLIALLVVTLLPNPPRHARLALRMAQAGRFLPAGG